MENKYSQWSFVLCCILLTLSLYSLYAAINQVWSVAPHVSVLWLLSVGASILAIVGLRNKKTKWAKFRSWLTVFFSLALSAVLFLGLVVNTFTRDLIETKTSPDSGYTIDFHTVNGGAATSIAVFGVVDGPLWLTKNIYKDNNKHKAEVLWDNDNTVTINNHTLDLRKGETFSD